jgi:hypothetical protein
MRFDRIVKLFRSIDARISRRGDRRAVLVNARTPMNYAVMRPVVEAMSQDQRVDFYFTASEQPFRIREVFNEAPPGARLISPKRAALRRFDAYIAADLLWLRLARGTRRIQMFHGVAGKYANIYDSPASSMRDWDRLFFINRRRLHNFIGAGAIDEESPNARLIGYPKLDCLLDGSLKRDEVLTAMGISPDSTTVLYAPTWSPYSSLNVMGEKLVESLCAAGYVVIVKLHDRSLEPQHQHSGGVNWPARLGKILRNGCGVLARKSDATPCLAAADALITDHSSVGFEYLLLDRPVIRIEMPELLSRTAVNPDYVALLAEASDSVRTAEQAVTSVGRALSRPAQKSGARRAIAAEIFHEAGTATGRAVAELYDVIELDSPGVLNEPAGSRPLLL